MSHSAQVWSVLFNPGDGGKTLASGSVDGTVILWDRDTGEPLSPPILNKTEVETMAISPDGHLLALGCFDHTITLWKISWESWLNRACSIANRNFSQAEWEEFIGLETPYQPTCPDLPPD
jgi:WD40 repeat protein